MSHPVLSSGRVAVITGGASGIGLAAAKRFASLGMRVVVADWNVDALPSAVSAVSEAAPGGASAVRGVRVDVSKLEDMQKLKDEAFNAFGEVGLLFLNAGVQRRAGPWDNYAGWQQVIGVNLWGVVNGIHTFAEPMIAQHTPCAIVVTGSKHGITCPPCDASYNVSKAAVKAATEALAHSLRTTPDCRVTAHLLIPGWTDTGLTNPSGTPKPAGAWTADQVIDFMLPELAKNTFYVLCPDNDVDRRTDEKRIAWAAGDIVHNRPALSRWHPDYKEKFAAFLASPNEPQLQ